MKNSKTHPIADYMQRFFISYLTLQRGLSQNTIAAYRDAMKLLLRFAAEILNIHLETICIEDLEGQLILSFLDSIEQKNGNSIKTRNARLAAIKSFFRFLAKEDPILLQQCQKICAIPSKKSENKPIDYLNKDEVKAILDSVETTGRDGLRDKALLLLLYNTGARAQEVVDITLEDIQFDSAAPQVLIHGKGKKQRRCPLWPETLTALKTYLDYRYSQNPNEQQCFLNRNGESITRFGIRYIVQKYAKKANKTYPELKKKTVTTHTFRHTTAVHLIQSGNEINMVRLWLGHEDINTTSIYAEIDMEMKRKIINSCRPQGNNAKNKKPKWLKPGILDWLEQLTKSTQLCAAY
jgi:site-specific recombinase XerD